MNKLKLINKKKLIFGSKKIFDFKKINIMKIKIIKIATLSVVRKTKIRVKIINNEAKVLNWIFLKLSLIKIKDISNNGNILDKKLPNFFSSSKKLVTKDNSELYFCNSNKNMFLPNINCTNPSIIRIINVQIIEYPKKSFDFSKFLKT